MTTDETVYAQCVLTKKLAGNTSVAVTAALVHLAGNELAYFSTTTQHGADLPTILEHFPQLTPVVQLHLADSNGVPMHAAANGSYFLGFTKPCADDAPNLETFSRMWRVTPAEAQRIYDRARSADDPQGQMRVEAENMSGRWAAQAEEALLTIQRHSDSMPADRDEPSVDRALDVAVAKGLIRSWHRMTVECGGDPTCTNLNDHTPGLGCIAWADSGKFRPRSVQLIKGTVALSTLDQAYAFACGLASAHDASKQARATASSKKNQP